jgi:alpha-galactosidase
MKQNTRIVLIGAGSREFARSLVHDLVLEKPLLDARSLHVVMVDLNAAQLELMCSYARLCAEALGAPMTFEATTDRREALKGADFVLISVAVKRMELWEQDFRVPFAYGLQHTYGENGGPGAAFHALRNFQIVIPICRDIEQICPDAWVLNFTNPEARILTAILTLTKVKAIGLCHGFYSFRTLVQTVLERPLSELDVRTAGINHFYTYYRICEKKGGRDLIPEFEGRLKKEPGRLPPLARYLWETFGTLGYISDEHIGEYVGFAHEFVPPLWPFGIEHRPVHPQEQGVDGRTMFEAWRRNVDVQTYLAKDMPGKEKEMLAAIRGLRKEDIRPSGELAVPVISDILLDRKGWRESVNVLNTGGFIENLDRDTAVELLAFIRMRWEGSPRGSPPSYASSRACSACSSRPIGSVPGGCSCRRSSSTPLPAVMRARSSRCWIIC